MRNKILHVSISSDIGGGPEHIYQLISGLPLELFENYMACPNNGPYYDKFKVLTQNRITIIPFRKFEFLALFRLYKYIKKNKINILHGHGKGAGLYCRIISIFLKIKVIHTPHGINQNNDSISSKLYIGLEKFFGFLINSVIFVSQSEFEYAKKLKIWKGVNTKVIFNGTSVISENEKSELRNKKREELNWINNTVVITASRFDFQKNTIEFCEIASKLPNITFAIIGDGEEKKQCEDFCSVNKIKNVSFLGSVPDPLNYFAAADIYLSTARWEGLSMAILESMALALPIIASKVVGNIDLIKVDINGYLYNLGNIENARRCINDCLYSENYINLSRNARRFHLANFSSKSMCLNTSNLYKEILN